MLKIAKEAYYLSRLARAVPADPQDGCKYFHGENLCTPSYKNGLFSMHRSTFASFFTIFLTRKTPSLDNYLIHEINIIFGRIPILVKNAHGQFENFRSNYPGRLSSNFWQLFSPLYRVRKKIVRNSEIDIALHIDWFQLPSSHSTESEMLATNHRVWSVSTKRLMNGSPTVLTLSN